MSDQLFFVHLLTPLHAGTGQGLGSIDLPTARDVVTNHPLLPGSSIKGSMRAAGRGADYSESEDLVAAFGPSNIGNDDNDHVGGLCFSDARLLCLPVRSLRGTFSWVTCQIAINRLHRDANACQIDTPGALPAIDNGAAHLGHHDSALLDPKANKVYFEELDLQGQPCGTAEKWATWLSEKLFKNPNDREQFQKRFAVISNDVFDFFCETRMDVRSRVKLEKDTKTVSKSGPWWEENVPAESIMNGVLSARQVRKSTPEAHFELINTIAKSPLQFGGKETVGRGRATLKLVGGM